MEANSTRDIIIHDEQNQIAIVSNKKRGKKVGVVPKDTKNGSSTGGTSKGTKAIWTPKMHAFWVDTCLELVRAGMRPTTHLNLQAYTYLITKFNEEFNVNYTRQQMKNHWDSTKKEWMSWNRLVYGHTNLRWDVENGVLCASNDWWDEQLRVNGGWAKWRETPLEHCFKLDEIFQDISVTGRRMWDPSFSGIVPIVAENLLEQKDSSSDHLNGGTFGHHKSEHNVIVADHNSEHNVIDDHNSEHNVIDDHNSEHNDIDDHRNEDADEGTETLRKVRKITASNGKESKSSRLTATQKILQSIDKLFSALESKSTASSEQFDIGKVDMRKALEAMSALPGIEIGGDLYMFGVDLFVRKDYRDMFLVLPTPELQLAFLQRKYNMSKPSSTFLGHMQQPFGSGSSQWAHGDDAYRANLNCGDNNP